MKIKNMAKATLLACLLATSANAAQELVRGNGAEPATLDPTLGEGSSGTNVMRDLFEGLMTIDSQGKVILGQAESYTISDDKKTYIFKIRKDAKWSNGDPVTANDFEYAFKRGINPKTAARYSWYFKILGIKNGADILSGKKDVSTLGVTSLDSKTLKITLGSAIPYFLIGLSHITTAPIPKKLVEKFGNEWTKPSNIISNGAYKLSQWVVNEKIVAVKNDNYYGASKVQIDKVTFLPISDGSTAYNRYQAGEIDFVDSLPSNKYKHLMKTIPNEVKILGLIGTYYYDLNMRKKPFEDIRVRRALSYSINREIIAKKVLGTGQKPAYSFTPDNISGFTPLVPEYAKWSQKEREEKALKLLSEAGFSKSHPLKFEILYNTNESHKRVALAISSMWNKVLKGAVKVTLSNQEWKTFLDVKNEGKFEVSRSGWTGDYNEASTMLDILTKGHSSNNSHYDNPLYDKLMNEARTTTDDKARNILYQKVNSMITRDMPVIPIYQYTKARLIKPYVKGFPTVSPLGFILTKYLSIKK